VITDPVRSAAYSSRPRQSRYCELFDLVQRDLSQLDM